MKGSRDIKPFGLRMPLDLREKLQKAADNADRSLNAEINRRLNKSLDEHKSV